MCEQYTTCNECSTATLCHWCLTENRYDGYFLVKTINMRVTHYRCAAVFECTHEKRNGNHMNMCTSIEQVIPNQILLDTTGTEVSCFHNNQICEIRRVNFSCKSILIFHCETTLMNICVNSQQVIEMTCTIQNLSIIVTSLNVKHLY